MSISHGQLVAAKKNIYKHSQFIFSATPKDASYFSGTGVDSSEKVIEQYGTKAQIKSVIADKKDFEYTFDVFSTLMEKLDHKLDTPWVLTPCYEPGEEFPRDRFIEILDLNEKFGSPFRVIGQQHKWIYGPDKRDV